MCIWVSVAPSIIVVLTLGSGNFLQRDRVVRGERGWLRRVRRLDTGRDVRDQERERSNEVHRVLETAGFRLDPPCAIRTRDRSELREAVDEGQHAGGFQGDNTEGVIAKIPGGHA